LIFTHERQARCLQLAEAVLTVIRNGGHPASLSGLCSGRRRLNRGLIREYQ
jgi:hypothetical protein